MGTVVSGATVAHLPLSFYVDKINRGEPFSSLLFGDGEFSVAAGLRTGQRYTQYREMVTPGLVAEMRDALFCGEADVVKGTDPNLINWRDYGGQDAGSFKEACRKFEPLFEGRDLTFTDGVIWDTAVKTGRLAPLLKALQRREVAVIANPRVAGLPFLKAACRVHVPDQDASGHLDVLQSVAGLADGLEQAVFVVCAGLASVPLIMRLRRQRPLATFLDLGSVLDLFVGEGEQRGWRRELYAKPDELRRIIDANLEGVGP